VITEIADETALNDLLKNLKQSADLAGATEEAGRVLGGGEINFARQMKR
jgi:hypothetical protein